MANAESDLSGSLDELFNFNKSRFRPTATSSPVSSAKRKLKDHDHSAGHAGSSQIHDAQQSQAHPHCSQKRTKQHHSHAIDSKMESFATDIGESFATDIGESFATDIGESFATDIGESFATDIGESFATDVGESFATDIGESFATDVGESFATDVGESFATDIGESRMSNSSQMKSFATDLGESMERSRRSIQVESYAKDSGEFEDNSGDSKEHDQQNDASIIERHEEDSKEGAEDTSKDKCHQQNMNEMEEEPIMYVTVTEGESDWEEEYNNTKFDDNNHGSVEVLQRKSVSKETLPYAVFGSQCCQKWCVKDLTFNELDLCLKERINTNWVLEKLKLFRDGKGSSSFVVAGKPLCCTAWRHVYNITERMYAEACKLQDSNVVEVIHGNKQVERICPKAEATESWLHHYIHTYGENMPHMSVTLLPCCLTKRMVFSFMVEEYRAFGMVDQIVKERQFYNIWKKSFNYVKIRKENNFTKCTPCTVSAEEKGKTMDKARRNAVDRQLHEHLKLTKQERSTYERHKTKSRRDNKYLCISIDGMDQSKTSLPHLARVDKGSQKNWRLQTHVTGAIIHGQSDYGKDFLVFLTTADLPSDSNLTINVLMHSLEMHVRKHNKLPEVLYLQFDNCWRENKNMYVLGFAFLLVALGIVQKVKINFLIVGHTHNDVDQGFSLIAEALRKDNALTLEDLNDVIKGAFERPPPQVKVLTHVHDFKTWLEPHFAGTFKNHTRPHCFCIKKINGKVVLHYRLYTGDQWEPSEGLHCLKTLPDLTDVAPWTTPIIDRVGLDILKRDIPKFFHRMGEGEQKWWTNYIANFTKMKEIPEPSDHWPMMTIASAVDTNGSDAEDENENLPANLGKIWQKLNKPMQPVTIGTQGKPHKPSRTPGSNQANVVANENDNLDTVEEYHGRDEDNTADDDAVDELEDSSDEPDMNQYGTIQIGMLVALYVKHHWRSSPQIARVMEVDMEAETVEVHWYSATWSGTCAPLFNGAIKNKIPKTEILDIRCCLLWDFKLTHKKGALSSATSQQLRSAYRELGEDLKV